MSAQKKRLRELHEELVRLEPYPWSNVQTWIAAARPLINQLYATQVVDFAEVCKEPSWTYFPRVSSGGGMTGAPRRNNFSEAAAGENASNSKKANAARGQISAFLESLLLDEEIPGVRTPLSIVLALLDRFPSVVRVLQHRTHNRTALQMNDEYDVQYLLGALLAVEFRDVRPEEWTPSHGGQSARVDFLLKEEKIVIETKFARAGDDRKLVDELIIDKERYAKHPDCEHLVCFVYDPNRALRNPTAIERDLSQQGPLGVSVIVR